MARPIPGWAACATLREVPLAELPDSLDRLPLHDQFSVHQSALLITSEEEEILHLAGWAGSIHAQVELSQRLRGCSEGMYESPGVVGIGSTVR